MHKTIVIIKNIKDLPSFEQYLKERALPYILNMEGTLSAQITSLQAIDGQEQTASDKNQFLIETYFESIENTEVLLEDPDGVEFLNELANHPNFEIDMFMGKESNIPKVSGGSEKSNKIHKKQI